MKKRMLLLFAMILIITMFPQNIYADASYTVTSIKQVAIDHNFSELASSSSQNIPLLRIEPRHGSILKHGDTFRLRLTNAKWTLHDYDGPDSYGTFDGNVFSPGSSLRLNYGGNYEMSVLAENLVDITIIGDLNPDYTADIPIEQLPDAPIDLTEIDELSEPQLNEQDTQYEADAGFAYYLGEEPEYIGSIGEKEDYEAIYIPILAKVTDYGTAEIGVERGLNYGLPEYARPFAYVSEGNTKISVGKVNDFADMLDIPSIIIDELIYGTLKEGTITLTAPSGFEWSNIDNIYLSALGFEGISYHTSYGSYGSGRSDRSVLNITVRFDEGTSAVQRPGTWVLNNLTLYAQDDDARKGDVSITIKGCGITSERIKIGNYVAYDTTLRVENKDLPQIVSGIYPKNGEDDAIETLKVTYKENAQDSWNSKRRTTFALPDGVKPRAVRIKTKNIKDGAADTTIYNIDDSSSNAVSGDNSAQWKLDDKGLTARRISVNDGQKAEVELTFYVSIEPGYEGDIELSVYEEDRLMQTSDAIARAISPIEVDTKYIISEIGLKNVPVADIIIRENIAGAISRSGINVYDGGSDSSSDALLIAVEDMDIDDRSAVVDVIQGDLTIEKHGYVNSSIAGGYGKNRNRALALTVKRESNRKSTIQITGMTVTIDRTLPRGDYELRIGGSLCANYSDRNKLVDGTFNKQYYVAQSDYVSIVTQSGNPNGSGSANQVVKVTIGSETMQVGNETIHLDTPAFIENNYTYIPVSAVATALGISQEKVVWNAIEKSVTIFNGNRTVKMTHNSKVLNINGIETNIDSPMIIRNNRTCLPFRVLGELVLGVPVTWDEYSRTAIFN